MKNYESHQPGRRNFRIIQPATYFKPRNKSGSKQKDFIISSKNKKEFIKKVDVMNSSRLDSQKATTLPTNTSRGERKSYKELTRKQQSNTQSSQSKQRTYQEPISTIDSKKDIPVAQMINLETSGLPSSIDQNNVPDTVRGLSEHSGELKNINL